MRGTTEAVVFTSLCLFGCTGLISEPGESVDIIDFDDPQVELLPPGELPVGSSPMRRLTNFEYRNTVRDLLGESVDAAGLARDAATHGYDNNALTQTVSPLLAEQYMEAAEEVSDRVDISELLPCDPVDGAACGRDFVVDFGARAFRRPLSTDEVDAYAMIFEVGSAADGFDEGIRWVIDAFLRSPKFLYRVEVGTGEPADGLVPLTDYELASRLSYFLWATMPDDVLFAAAEAGELRDAAGRTAQITRMLADPKAEDSVRHFHEQWLQLTELATLTKDPEIFPEFESDLALAWQQETGAFAVDVILANNGTLRDLLTASYTVGDARLASLYDAAPPDGGFGRIELDPTQRAGILTQGGILATNSLPDRTQPIYRGRFVARQLLCTELPDPPANVMTTFPEPDPDATVREQITALTSPDQCAGCHAVINPPGFALERYDSIGRYRSTDEYGQPIDDSGAIVVGDADGEFNGAIELAGRIADSRDLVNCATENWFRYSHGRAQTNEDRATLRYLASVMAEADGNVQALLIAITQTQGFTHRVAL